MPSLNKPQRTPNQTDQASDSSAENLRSVHVRFRPAEGRRLQRPEPTGCPGEDPLFDRRPVLMERADGTYELIGRSRNLAGLAQWILSFGTGAEACGPDRLRRQVALQAWRIWRQYAGD